MDLLRLPAGAQGQSALDPEEEEQSDSEDNDGEDKEDGEEEEEEDEDEDEEDEDEDEDNGDGDGDNDSDEEEEEEGGDTYDVTGAIVLRIVEAQQDARCVPLDQGLETIDEGDEDEVAEESDDEESDDAWGDEEEEEEEEDDAEEEGSEITMEMQDLRSRAVRMYIELHESDSGLNIVSYDQHKISKFTRTFAHSGPGKAFKPALPYGWAVQAKQGKGTGERYLQREPWGSIAEKMFMKGEKSKGEKSSPGEIHERILQRAAALGRYDTPSLIEVSKLVSSMVGNAKMGRRRGEEGRGGEGRNGWRRRTRSLRNCAKSSTGVAGP